MSRHSQEITQLTAFLAEEALGVVQHAVDLHAPRRDGQSALGAVHHGVGSLIRLPSARRVDDGRREGGRDRL